MDRFEDCKMKCLSNCSCLAYTYVNNIGCLVWYKELFDNQQYPSLGEDLYIRLAYSELGEGKPRKLIANLTSSCLTKAWILSYIWLYGSRVCNGWDIF
ncbi:G-type lectin S-receptor-like serine/threonine-protein kinase SD1-29 [Argentina anserina]|uniref:G-type lectin S-receptor-like serine/threonine-protein kinase SD1-29 n=1 Tax=Argentina anserina TaxID=57926 RepID=UPI002176438E|nr:G-type lectin S-receptor-like serine/threonine-protein kinase SD1-29 [Potentilla anserina]